MTIRSDHKTTARCSFTVFLRSGPLPVLTSRTRSKTACRGTLDRAPSLPTHTYHRPSSPIGLSLEHPSSALPLFGLYFRRWRGIRSAVTPPRPSEKFCYLSPHTHTLLHSASRYPALRPPSWGLLGDMGQHHTHTVTEALRSNQPRCNSQAGNTYRWSGTSTDGLRDLVSITKTLHVHNSLFQVSVLISSVRYLLTMCRRFKSSETVL